MHVVDDLFVCLYPLPQWRCRKKQVLLFRIHSKNWGQWRNVQGLPKSYSVEYITNYTNLKSKWINLYRSFKQVVCTHVCILCMLKSVNGEWVAVQRKKMCKFHGKFVKKGRILKKRGQRKSVLRCRGSQRFTTRSLQQFHRQNGFLCHGLDQTSCRIAMPIGIIGFQSRLERNDTRLIGWRITKTSKPVFVFIFLDGIQADRRWEGALVEKSIVHGAPRRAGSHGKLRRSLGTRKRLHEFFFLFFWKIVRQKWTAIECLERVSFPWRL